jgi:ribosome biogenesis protein MAK21
MKQNELLRIIKSLGGDKTDLDLIDSKGDEIIKINEDELKNDLSKFMSQFDFSQYDDDTDEDQVYDEISSNESENEKEDGEEIYENDENATCSENNDADKPLLKESFSAKLLVDPTTPWHLQVQFTNRINDMVKLKMLKEKASFLYENEVKLFQKRKDSKSNKDFTAKVIKNGTTFDKISLFTLLIQESPVHQFKVLNDFFQKKPQKKQLVIIAESIKDLMINTILPDRKLKFFVDSCCSNRNVLLI